MRRIRVAPEEQTLHLFSGFVKCGWCGGNMTRKTIPVKGKKYIYLVCIENKNKNGCENNKAIPLAKFEKIVLEVINFHIEKVVELNQMLEIREKVPYHGYLSGKLQDEIREKERQIEKKRQYTRAVYEDYKEEIVSREEYFELKEAFRTGISALEKEIRALKREIQKLAVEKSDKVQWVEQFIRCRGFRELTREMLLRLIEEIRIYDKDRIEVIFKFQSEYEALCQYAANMENCMEGGNTDGTEEQEKQS